MPHQNRWRRALVWGLTPDYLTKLFAAISTG
jgi:hypothetical protein